MVLKTDAENVKMNKYQVVEIKSMQLNSSSIQGKIKRTFRLRNTA